MSKNCTRGLKIPTKTLIVCVCVGGGGGGEGEENTRDHKINKEPKQMSRLVGKPAMWFSNRSDINRPVQLQKQARSLKFWSYVEEELHYPSSENKGADQLRGYREADLRLCFRLGRLLVFPRGGSNELCHDEKTIFM